MRSLALSLAAALGVAAALRPAPPQAAQWKIAYFYDKEDSSLVINDLRFPSATRGVAVGYLEEKGRSKPVSVSTDDGGLHWTVSKLKDVPISLFFLDANTGWMVTPQHIWETADAGRTWRELHKSPKLLMKVYFLDASHGFAVGAHKLAYRTDDGGKTWQPIPAADSPHTNPEDTVYNNISFINSHTGLIDGFAAAPHGRDSDRPDWLDPREAFTRQERPHLSIALSTDDGGRTWTSSTASMFGHITRAVFLPSGRGLGLVEFTHTFKWPSEVQLIDEAAGKSKIVYNAPDRAITDVLLLRSGTAYLAGVAVEGRLQHSPIPNKLVVLQSTDLTSWHEMAVDYRAVAVRAMLRAAPGGALWVATDTGMILKLAE